MTDQPFHEPTFIAALERAETIIASPDTYSQNIRQRVMRDLYRIISPFTSHKPLDAELARLTTKLERLYSLPDEGKAVSAWDTSLARYTRFCDHQWRVMEAMRKDRHL